MSIFIAEGVVVWGWGRRLPHVQIKLAEVLSREHLQQIQDMLWVVCWYWVSGVGRIDDVLVVEFAARQPRAALSWDVVCLFEVGRYRDEAVPSNQGGGGGCRTWRLWSLSLLWMSSSSSMILLMLMLLLLLL